MIEPRVTPGVYIKELNAFPNSVVEVATALPVFIGYTQQASYQGTSLSKKLVQVTSMQDFSTFFGGAPNYQFALTAVKSPTVPDVVLSGTGYAIAPANNSLYYLYNSIRLFYMNGGGTCYVVSIGDYSAGVQQTDFVGTDAGSFNVFSMLETEQDPTLILMPDALLLGATDYFTLSNLALNHCSVTQSRMTLMDVPNGNVTDPLAFAAMQASNTDPVSLFRNGITSEFLNYGASYFPWLNTSIVQNTEVNFNNISGGVTPYLEQNDTITKITAMITTTMTPAQITQVHNALLTASPNYNTLMTAILAKLNCLPPTPAIAGVISTVDGSQGVWKAPANVGLNAVNAPTLNLSDAMQGPLNVDAISGKSINAIRSFTGMGVMVWGARTLDGNSQDWRYLSVRRTLIMIEQSVKLATKAYVFEANDANTWISLQSMIENFLTNLWKQGALAGSKASDAFSVSVGLGSTMTAQDILDGYLDVSVLVAVTHPAEFIEITFQQQLQKS